MAVTPTPPKKLVFHQCMGETSQPSGKSHGPSKWVHQSVTASIFSIWSGAMCLPPHLDIFASHISFFGAFINDPKKSTRKSWKVASLQTPGGRQLGMKILTSPNFPNWPCKSWTRPSWRLSLPPNLLAQLIPSPAGPLEPVPWRPCMNDETKILGFLSRSLFFWDANFLLGPSKMALNLCFTELIFTLRTGSYRRYFTPISTWWQGHLVEKTQENTDLLTADTFRKTMFNRKWHRIVVVETRGCCVQKSDSRKQKIVVVAVVLLRIVWLLGDHTIWRGPLTCNTRF